MKKTDDINKILKYIESIKDIDLFIVDLFCGCGGLTEGAEQAKVDGRKCAIVVGCVNHDTNAINSHRENHPYAFHAEEDIRTLDLSPLIMICIHIRQYHPYAKILLHASAECTNFSKAKGGQSRDADSRTLPQSIYRYIKVLNPDYITVENVIEFLTDGPLIIKEKKTEEGYPYCPCNIKKEKAKKRLGIPEKWFLSPQYMPDPEHKGEYYEEWRERIKSFGYDYEYRILNSADYGARTRRIRYFGTFAKPGLPIIWPKITHFENPEDETKNKWLPVREVLDLSKEGESIFTRNVPLVDATIDRVSAGCIKFCNNGDGSFLAAYYGTGDNVSSVNKPCPTVSTKDRFNFVNPKFIMNYYSGGGQLSDLNNPCPTLTAKPKQHIVNCHFIDQQYGNSIPSSIDEPINAITANPKYNPITLKKWILSPNFNNKGHDLDEPAPTIMACRKHHYLMNPQYTSKGGSIDKPCFTLIARMDKTPPYLITTTDSGESIPSFIEIKEDRIIYNIYDNDTESMKRIKIIMAHLGIIDIKMRMLEILELKKIMGFPDDYVLIGKKEEQKKYIGNAVEVNQGRVLIEAIANGIKEYNQESSTRKIG